MGALSDLMKGKTSVQPQKKIGGLKGLLEQSKKKPVPQARPITQAQPVQPVLPSYVKNTLPRDLGGGSYYSIPGQPNQLIRPEAKKTYGSLPVKQGQQRDHFIAQSLGGASDDYNINYVPSEVNQKWGNIETRNLNAYKRGEISLPQARLNVLKEKQEWLLKQKGISQSVKDNLIQIAKDPINPVNIVKGVLKKITSPLSLVKEYAKAIAPKQIAELEQTKAPDNKSMRFEVSNVEKVLPGPRISTLNAIQQGAKIEPVKVGEAPVISPERQIKTQLADEAGYRKEITGGLSSMTPKEAGVGALQALAGGVRATSVYATLPFTATANLLSKEKVTFETLVDATVEMVEDDIKTGGRANTGKAAQMYLQSRGVGKYGGNEVNLGDIAVLATIGLGDTMGDPLFYYGMVKPALNQLKFATQFKKTGQVSKALGEGVKITQPQKSIVSLSDDLKIVVDPKSNKITFKGYVRRGAKGEVLNQKAITGVVDDIARNTGQQLTTKFVGNDIILTPKVKAIPSPKVVSAGKVVIPKAKIKPQKAQGDVLPTKTTKVSSEVKPALKSAKLDTLNPTGSIFADYTPAKRATAELADNITTLDKTMKKPADEMITIYRGTSKGSDIVAGDFVTTNKQLAKDYAGTGRVIEKKVKLSDILDDLDEPLGEEYIYRPQARLKPSVVEPSAKQGDNLPKFVNEIEVKKTDTNKFIEEQTKIINNLTDEQKSDYLSFKKDAYDDFPNFKDRFDGLTEEMNLTVLKPVIKSDARAVEKAIKDEGGVFSVKKDDNGRLLGIKDMVRAAIIENDYKKMAEVVEKIKDKFNVIRVKNRLDSPSYGYRDVLINVMLPNGTVGEIQIMTPAMSSAKKINHILYEESRAPIDYDKPLLPQEIKKTKLKILQIRNYEEANLDNILRYQRDKKYTLGIDKLKKVKYTTIADEAYSKTLENGGVTISLKGKQPTTGYSYSPYKGLEVKIAKSEFTNKDYLDFLKKNHLILSRPGHYIGGWEDDGFIYFDVSKVGKPEPKTIEEAQKNNQLAVFDLESLARGNDGTINIGTIGDDGKYTVIDSPDNLNNKYKQSYEKTNVSNINRGKDSGGDGERGVVSNGNLPENIGKTKPEGEKGLKQSLPKKPKPSIEPLIEEAKKYKTADEFVKENSIKHISQEQVLPKKQGDIQFYHGTDVLNYDKLSIPKFEGSTMDRNYGDYFYITPDRSLTETYGRYSAGFNIPKEKVLPLEKYRSLWNAEKGTGISEKAFDDKLFKDYWAIEMPDNEFIVKDVSKIRDYTKSQLTDIWNKANKKPLLPSKPKPKKQPIKYVPVEKPVDLRKKITTESIVAKPSIPQRIKAESIKSGLEDVFGDIEYYNKVSVKSQAEETAKLINEDYDRAIRIAMGQENAPGDLLPESVLIGVKNQAIKSGDTELLINLATAEGGVARESTVLGQRIKMLDEGLEDDAFRNIKKVVSERRNNYQKKTGKSVDKAIKQETDKIKEAIKKSAPKKDDWLDFVNSITC